jgi:hypothetical protein
VPSISSSPLLFFCIEFPIKNICINFLSLPHVLL